MATSSLPIRKAVPKTASKSPAHDLYGANVTKAPVSSVKVNQQGAGDNVKRKQVIPKATSLGPADRLYGSKK